MNFEITIENVWKNWINNQNHFNIDLTVTVIELEINHLISLFVYLYFWHNLLVHVMIFTVIRCVFVKSDKTCWLTWKFNCIDNKDDGNSELWTWFLLQEDCQGQNYPWICVKIETQYFTLQCVKKKLDPLPL